MWILFQFLYRLFYLFEEFHHLLSRHEDSVKSLLIFVFKTNSLTFFTFIISSVSWFVVNYFLNFNIFTNIYTLENEISSLSIFIALLTSYFFIKIIDIVSIFQLLFIVMFINGYFSGRKFYTFR